MPEKSNNAIGLFRQNAKRVLATGEGT